MLRRYMEGEKVDVDGGKIVDVDRRPDPCPGGTPAPPEARGREPPTSSSSLASPLDGEEDSPSAPWSPMAAVGREPLLHWISLSVLFCFAFSRSGRKLFLIFREIRNSDCAEILTRFFFPDISFLVPKVELQPTYEEDTRHL